MKSSQRWLIVILAIGILLVFALGASLLFTNNPSSNALPTLVAINTANPSELIPSENPEDTAELQVAAASPTEAVATDLPTETASPEPSPILPSPTLAPSETSIPASPSPTTETLQLPPSPEQSSGAIVPVASLAPSNTPSPSNTPAAGNTTAPVIPSATLDATGLVVYNQPQNIGVGELRLLSMTAPADEVILSLGSSIPNIQANQQWVLVELFLICPSESNCAPSNNNFSLVSTGGTYSPTALNIESSFGSLLLGNQVLGHIAYVIPRNESPFSLDLTLNGQTYRFALR